MQAEAVLLVDNSNTRTKLMLSEGDKLVPGQRVLATADITPETIAKLLEGWSFSRVLICSVVPAAAATLKESFSVPVSFVSASSLPDLLKDYPGADTLGADRIANAAAVVSYGRFPCVAVDLGTAVTFDVVSREGQAPSFAGGVIAPGLSAFTRYLSSRTALLPEPDLSGKGAVVGRNTQESMKSGALIGFRGMVREILCEISRELGTKPYVYATGGDAALLAEVSGIFDEYVPLLTFQGLNIICRMAR